MSETGSRVQSKLIAERPEAGDASLRRRRHIAAPAERLAGLRIGQVDFDHRHRDSPDRIIEGDRAVGESPGIEDYRPRTFGAGLVKPVDEMPLVVRLAHVDREAELACPVFEAAGNLIQRLRAINLRLARAEKVEVGAVQHIDGR